MFRKTIKQIKIFVILIILLICLPHSILPHRTLETGKAAIEKYLLLNDIERRLIEFRDDSEALKLKLIQLEIINNSRRKYNAPPVSLDILASRLANKISREAAENEYLGHWNLAGEEPYLRYAFAGGYDHVSENIYGEWSSDNFPASSVTISTMMKKGHLKFMAERAPDDGHKINIIDKSHNFIGLGFCLAGKQFRYYEEFINRYFEFENIPQEVKPEEQFKIRIKTSNNRFLYYIIIYRQNWPQKMTSADINKKGSYCDFTQETYKEFVAWDLAKHRNGIIYEIPLRFSDEGLYYIQMYSDKKEITNPTSLTTSGKTPESGIVIKVKR